MKSNPLASYLALGEEEIERLGKSSDRAQLQGGASRLWVMSEWVVAPMKFESWSFFFLVF